MKIAFVREQKLVEEALGLFSKPLYKETGIWLGPFEFIEWGKYQGDTMAILRKEDGDIFMAYPGQIKLVDK